MSVDLLGEIRPARLDLLRRRVAVLGRPALDDVGDVALGPGQADLLPHEAVEQLARAADEGLTGQVLLAARTLAHEEQVGRRRADAEDDLGAALGQRAQGARRRGDAQPLEGVGVRHRARRGGYHNARHARADAAHHLVADRPRHGRPVVRRDLLVALPPEQHDLVARPDRVVVAAVDDDLVHRHRPGQGPAHAADEHLVAPVEEAAGHAVGVADGDRGHERARRQRTQAAVGGALPRRRACARPPPAP